MIARLTALDGVGVWTAEMMLIFPMQRPDVVSWGDLAIRRGMMRLYGKETLDRAAFDRYRRRYSPYGLGGIALPVGDLAPVGGICERFQVFSGRSNLEFCFGLP